MNNHDEQSPNKWDARYNAFRTSLDFADVARVIACYYDMYSKAYDFVGPWIAKQRGGIFVPPDVEQVKAILGKERPTISPMMRIAFANGIVSFLMKTRGRKNLIIPNATSHHSAQFNLSAFEIKMLSNDKHPKLIDDQRRLRPVVRTIHEITLYGIKNPIYVENLQIPIDSIKYLIVRPQLGKLGIPSMTRWEVLLFKDNPGYLVEHIDSNLNPKFSGIL